MAAASSPKLKAPISVITPDTSHTISSRAGLFTWWEMSAETMKMPDPTIEPATIIVASKRPSPFTSPGPWGAENPEEDATDLAFIELESSVALAIKEFLHVAMIGRQGPVQ